MARHKIPENETPNEKQERQIKESVANAATRSEKTSWQRKMSAMVKLLAKLRPIENRIIKLQNQKIPLFDEVQKTRNTMVEQCIHPIEYLIVEDGYVLCKFCNCKIAVNDDSKET